MAVTLPSWFKYRQGKAEPAGDNLLKLSGPQMNEGVVGVREASGGWQGFVRPSADAPDLESTRQALPTLPEAWAAAFELFRVHFII